MLEKLRELTWSSLGNQSSDIEAVLNNDFRLRRIPLWHISAKYVGLRNGYSKKPMKGNYE